jgi:hypothetical protein
MTKRFAMLAVSVSCLIVAFRLPGLLARDEQPSDWKTLELRYAQANLELAQARLALANSQNQKAASTISQDVIDTLKAGVKLTQDKLQQLQAPATGNGSTFAPQIVAAQDGLKALIDVHNQSLQANKLQPDAVPDPKLRREQAEIDVAAARVAALQSLARQPFEVRIEWQIAQLQDDIRALGARPLISD